MSDKRIRIFALVLPVFTAVIFFIYLKNIDDILATYAWSYSERYLTAKDATAIVKLTLVLIMMVQGLLAYCVFNNKTLTGLVTWGSVLIILFTLGCYLLYLAIGSAPPEASMYLYLLPVMCGVSTILLARLYKTRTAAYVVFLSFSVLIVIVPSTLLLLNSICPYWLDNGHHVDYYSSGKKWQEYTLHCGSYRNEKIEWYENGQVKSYIHYKHDVVDSFAEFEQDGKRTSSYHLK